MQELSVQQDTKTISFMGEKHYGQLGEKKVRARREGEGSVNAIF